MSKKLQDTYKRRIWMATSEGGRLEWSRVPIVVVRWDDVCAVDYSDELDPGKFVPAPGEVEMELPEEEWPAFQQAGWRFMRPGDVPGIDKMPFGCKLVDMDGRKRTVSAVYTIEPELSAAQKDVLLTRRLAFLPRQILLGTNEVVVEFLPGVDEVGQEDLMRRCFDLDTRGRLARWEGQGDLLFVRLPDDGARNGLNLALRVEEEEGVVAAEPTFRENIRVRQSGGDVPSGRGWQLKRIRCIRDEGVGAWACLEAHGSGLGRGVSMAVIDHGFHLGSEATPNEHLPASERSAVFSTSWWGGGGSNGVVIDMKNYDHPESEHGTAVASIALGRNRTDLELGVAPESTLLALSCQGNGVCEQKLIAFALIWARDPQNSPGPRAIFTTLGPNGARVHILGCALRWALNALWDSSENEPQELLFWAVANGYVDTALDQVVMHPSVIGVGQSNECDRPTDSAYGQALDFLAPGRMIWSGYDGTSNVRPSTGTSNAAACAAGIAALALAARGLMKLDSQDILELLTWTCRAHSGGPGQHHPRFGYGRLDAYEAVNRLLGC